MTELARPFDVKSSFISLPYSRVVETSRANQHAFIKLRTRLYAFYFTSSCITIYPLYAIMFKEQGGLSTVAISSLFFIWTAVTALAEIPTGLIADRFSRRWSLVGYAVLQGLCFATWLLMPTFAGYAIGFVLWAIGYALQSGAGQAYLWDELTQLQSTDAYTKLFNRTQSMTFTGMAIAYGAAYLIGPGHYQTLLSTSIILCAVAAGIAFVLPKEQHRGHEDLGPRVETLRATVAAVLNSKRLLRITAAIAVMTGVVGTVEEYVPLYYSVAGLNTGLVPLVLLLGLFVTSVLSWFAHRLEHASGAAILTLVIAASAVLSVTSFGSTVVAIGGMFIFMRVVLIVSTLFQASLQHGYDGASRATVGSLATFVGYFVALVVIALYGMVTAMASDFEAIRAVALFTLISALALAMFWGKSRLVPKQPHV